MFVPSISPGLVRECGLFHRHPSSTVFRTGPRRAWRRDDPGLPRGRNREAGEHLLGRGDNGGGVGKAPSAIPGGVLIHARAMAAAGADRVAGEDYGPTRGRRLPRRNAPLSKPPPLVRDGEFVSAGRVKARRTLARGAVCLRSLGAWPERLQDGLPVAGHLVRPPRLRVPRVGHAAVGRNRRHPSWDLPRGPVVVAFARLYARRRRMLERRARDRLSDQPPGSGPRTHRGDRHQRRRGGHLLDRRGGRAGEGRGAGQRDGRSNVLCAQPCD